MRNKKALSVFSLIMINIIAVDSLRSLPISAEYGASIIFFYLLCGLCFLLPVALVAAELATGWPQTGGIYIWVREAFGKRAGFFIIWLQWLYNVLWYPTILSLLAATLAYVLDPHLADDKFYLWMMSVTFFWAATLANWFGMRLSSWVSTVATIFGTLLPMIMIIGMALIWLLQGKPTQIHFTWHTIMPNFSQLSNLALLSSVLFGLIGLEMSAVHAGDVENPQRDYPRALFVSAVIILSTLAFGSLAIAIVVPQHAIQLASGLMQGFSIFFNAYHMPWMTHFIAIVIIIGGLGTVSAWIIGPSKGLMIAADDHNVPTFFAHRNRYHVPSTILFIQAIIFTVLSTLFIFLPNINTAFGLLSQASAQVAILVYVLIFSSAIRLRYTQKNVTRTYRIPGGNLGMWLIAGIGIAICLLVFGLGLLPPSQIVLGSPLVYEIILWSIMLLICLPPLLLRRRPANHG